MFIVTRIPPEAPGSCHFPIVWERDVDGEMCCDDQEGSGSSAANSSVEAAAVFAIHTEKEACGHWIKRLTSIDHPGGGCLLKTGRSISYCCGIDWKSEEARR